MGVPDDEKDWIRQCLAGDQGAFAPLVGRHQRLIHALTYRMTGSLTEADDLTQETFIQAFRQLDSFRGESSLSSWLYRIATNLSLNHQKSRARRQTLHERWAEEDNTQDNDNGISNAVQEALLRLPSKQRAAIVLTTYEGLNHAEAAQILGCSETTVSWRIFMAKRQLKRWLQPIYLNGGVHAS